MMKPEEILECTDIELLEDEAEIAGGYCSEHNSCDSGCRCFIDDGECIYNLINEHIKDLERKQKIKRRTNYENSKIYGW